MSGLWTPPDTRLAALCRYVTVAAVGDRLREFAQMPLYTLWRTGTGGEIINNSWPDKVRQRHTAMSERAKT